jgi:hypothetical protein
MKLRDRLREHLREAALIGVALIAITLLEYEGFIDKRRNRGGY